MFASEPIVELVIMYRENPSVDEYLELTVHESVLARVRCMSVRCYVRMPKIGQLLEIVQELNMQRVTGVR